jgi:DNA gyrase subunit B
LEKLIKDEVINSLQSYFKDNPNKLKECINIVKTNARARREGDKARNSVIKETLTNWSSFKMKNYDPCTNKGKEYKELYIIEGDSAKGSLKKSRDPMYQALFAIRGVSANVFKLRLDQIIGPNGNKEFNDLVKVMGCNVGVKFDITKLQFDKIIIASDADVDGLFIRSLLCSFFFKLFPEIILAGKLFIAEPPLYRIDDKKDPFVINKEDYNNRYIQKVMKEHKIGFPANKSTADIEWLNKSGLNNFLSASSSYVDDITMLSKHYLVNDRLVELILEEFADYDISMELALSDNSYIDKIIKSLQVQKLMVRIGAEFEELYYDDNDRIIKGAIDGKYQSLEISERLIRKSLHLIDVLSSHGPRYGELLVLKDIKTGSEHHLSMLNILKMLKKYQPTVIHRFKGLGENNDEDIKITIMDPNTRCLIRLQISDIENDMKTFMILRGPSPMDSKNRKIMMHAYKIPKDLIDT